MRRGEVVLAVFTGDYGKPRPGVVVQTDLVNATHASVVLCPMTSHIANAPIFRIDVEPDEENGLIKPSQIMVDKIVTLRRDRIRQIIGILDKQTQVRLNRSLALWLGLA